MYRYRAVLRLPVHPAEFALLPINREQVLNPLNLIQSRAPRSHAIADAGGEDQREIAGHGAAGNLEFVTIHASSVLPELQA